MNGLNWMPIGLVVSRPLIVNMVLFVNITISLKCITIYGMIFIVTHWRARSMIGWTLI